MLKRSLCLLLSMLLLALSGCSSKRSDYQEPENRLFVSSLGVDRVGENFEICAEAVEVAENSGTNEYKVKRYSGKGKSVAAAMYEITNDLPKKVNLSHCALIVLGEGVQGEYFPQVLDYCVNNNEITLSAFVAAAYNAKDLLSFNKELSEPLGYEIATLLKEDLDGTALHNYCTVLSVINTNKEKNNCLLLPCFSAKDKEIYHIGARLMQGNNTLCKLSRGDTQLMAVATNKFLGGELKVETENNQHILKVTDSNTKISCKEEGTLSVEVALKAEKGDYNKKEVAESLEKAIYGLFVRFRDRYSFDAFGVMNSSNAKGRFANTEIEVCCSIKGGGF